MAEMTRPIKFRAIRKDSDQWVFGYYVVFIAMTGESKLNGQITLDNGTKIHAIVDEIGCVHDVIPETVGQFTGLHDKNGKEIYEGDVVQYNEGSEEKPVLCNLDIEWVYNGFYAVGFDGFSALVNNPSGGKWRYEIISNIHEQS